MLDFKEEEIKKFAKSYFLRIGIGIMFYPLDPPVSITIRHPSLSLKDLMLIYKGYYKNGGMISTIKSSNAGIFPSVMHTAVRESLRINLISLNNNILGKENTDTKKVLGKVAILSLGDTIAHPIDTIKVRMGQGRSVKEGIKEVIKQRRLYNGVFATLSKATLLWSSLLLTDNIIKSSVRKLNSLEEDDEMKMAHNLQVTLAKGAFASILIFPAEVAAVSLQGAKSTNSLLEKRQVLGNSFKNYKLLSKVFCLRGTSNFFICATWNVIFNIMANNNLEKSNERS